MSIEIITYLHVLSLLFQYLSVNIAKKVLAMLPIWYASEHHCTVIRWTKLTPVD